MSVVKSNTLQLGQSLTASQNFCWYQPSSPDGTVRLGNGNAGSVTDLVTLTSAGNLGIGTSSPGAKLDVAFSGSPEIKLRSTSSGSAYLTLTPAGGGSGVISTSVGQLEITTQDASSLILKTSNTTRATLDSSGNLGLGVTPSAWSANYKALQIGAYTGIAQSLTDDGLEILANAYGYGTNQWKYLDTYGASRYRQSNGVHYWYTAPSGTAGNAISFTQAMTLDASGNLSVGTTGLGGKLYVVSGGASSVAGRFDTGVAGDVSQAPVYIVKYDNNTTTSQGFLKFFINNGGAASGVITANGANAATFSSTSDYRLKENITALPPQLANILALKPSEFDFIDGSGHQIGFIAQEMLEVYPDCVSENEDKMLMISGWSKTEARLVKAIQELSAELNELKKRIN